MIYNSLPVTDQDIISYLKFKPGDCAPYVDLRKHDPVGPHNRPTQVKSLLGIN